MKSETIGRAGCEEEPFLYTHRTAFWVHGCSRHRREVASDYLRSRWNHESQSPLPSVLPSYCQPDVENARWMEVSGKPGWYQVVFTEGPATKAFVEAQDRLYLSNIASSDPALFLKEMTPREELSAADQALKLGLDLSLPHHQNLQREYAATVERLRAAAAAISAAAPARGGAAAAAAEVPAREGAVGAAVASALGGAGSPTMRELPAAVAAAVGATPAAPMPAAAAISLKKISHSELTLGRKLGIGGFGEVYQGTWDYNDVAIKKFKPEIVIDDEVSRAFIDEAEIMATHPHPSIATLYAICLEPRNYSMVMKYYPKGSLFSWLYPKDPAERERAISWSLRIRIAKEILLGLKFLHSNHLLHRDVKSQNILLDESEHAVVADFGLAKTRETIRHSTGVMSGFEGSMLWAAPEIFEGKAPTTASDFYSAGVIFLELATRQEPLKDAASIPAIMFQIMSGRAAELAKIPADTPAPFATLIRNLIKNDPKERPTAEAALGVLGEVEALLAGVPGF